MGLQLGHSLLKHSDHSRTHSVRPPSQPPMSMEQQSKNGLCKVPEGIAVLHFTGTVALAHTADSTTNTNTSHTNLYN